MTAPPPVDAEAVHRALAGVLDPCSIGFGQPVDICSLGLVEDVAIESAHVRVQLVLTDVTCVHYTGLRRHVADAVAAVDGVEGVTVELAPRTVWTPDRARLPGPLPILGLT